MGVSDVSGVHTPGEVEQQQFLYPENQIQGELGINNIHDLYNHVDTVERPTIYNMYLDILLMPIIFVLSCTCFPFLSITGLFSLVVNIIVFVVKHSNIVRTVYN